MRGTETKGAYGYRISFWRKEKASWLVGLKQFLLGKKDGFKKQVKKYYLKPGGMS